MQSEEKALVRLAAEIARRAFDGRLADDGRTYYEAHVLEAHRLVEQAGGGCMEQVAALLRDAVAETDVTIDHLGHRGIPEPALDLLARGTRPGDG